MSMHLRSITVLVPLAVNDTGPNYYSDIQNAFLIQTFRIYSFLRISRRMFIWFSEDLLLNF